jgi:serine/threonine protein kinase
MIQDAVRLQRVSELFEAARLCPAEDRARFLGESCEDAALRNEVAALLRHHDDAAAPLEAPLLREGELQAGKILDEGISASKHPDIEVLARSMPRREALLPHAARQPRIPESIGDYRILRVLGEGGMGVVYLAEQTNPRRHVALKVIRTGIPSHRALRRFEFEASILGMLNHPGIAQIYEAGTHNDGRGLPQPYFAMEYVQGEPLVRFARERILGTRAKLELMAMVCDAVQHAHLRGVIHRDLKPGNILVAKPEGERERDGEAERRRDEVLRDDAKSTSSLRLSVSSSLPVIKILDFGVARATESDLHVTTMHTDVGQLVGTLQYMSPEQVSGDIAQLDTRSDVYALGVILYELLAGRLPYALEGKSIPEAARMIEETEPTPLSSVNRVFRGDLQTITARALEKEKQRRYASAADLAEDIRRYLRDEPIEAKRDSVTYLLRKRLRRYRLVVGSAVMLALCLSAFATYATLQAQEEHRLAQGERAAREESQRAEREAMAAGRLAAAQRDAAQHARDAEAERSREAQAVTAFLVGTLDLANPDVTQTPDMTKEMMLQRAADEVATAFPGQPQAEATVRAVIGKAYAALGEMEAAEHHLARALTLRRALPAGLGPPDAAALYDVLWPYSQVLDDLFDPSRLLRRNEMIDTAIELVSAPEGGLPEIRAPLEAMFESLLRTRDAKIATENYRLTLALLEKLPADAAAWTPAADLLHAAGELMHSRGRNLPELGREALEVSLQKHRARLGETNTRVVGVLSDLIDLSLSRNDGAAAEAYARQSLVALKPLLPEDHWYVAHMRGRLGASLRVQRRYAEAEMAMLEALPRVIDDRGPGSPQASMLLHEIVRMYIEWNRPEDAAKYRPQLARAFAGTIGGSSVFGSQNIFEAEHAELVAALEALQKKVSAGEKDVTPEYETVLQVWRRTLPDADPRSAIVADTLTLLCDRMSNSGGSIALAARMAAEAVRIDGIIDIRHPRRKALSCWQLARRAELERRYTDGEVWARRAIEILESGPAERFGFIANAESVLGACLAGQGRLEEAEPLLVRGYQVQRRDLTVGNHNTIAAAQRLITFYETTGREDDADVWRLEYLREALRADPPDAASLNSAAWRIVRRTGQSDEARALALQAAQRAVENGRQRKMSNLPSFVNTLGAAQYRNGRYEQALATLREADSLRAANDKHWWDAVFLAMTLHALGQTDEAARELARARQLHDAKPQPQENERAYTALLAEAQGRIAQP